MSKEKNFLLGHGERLTGPVLVPTGGSAKAAPYSFQVAKERIAKNLSALEKELDTLPTEACPNGQVVALVTMHPRYVSKSDFPEDLFKAVGLRSIGSKSASITPDNWGTKKKPEKSVITEQVFVAGSKRAFTQWAEQIAGWQDNQKASLEITHIENISAFTANQKVKEVPKNDKEALFEVVLHNAGDKSIVQAFEAYAKAADAKPLMNRRKDVGGLTFIPVIAPTSSAIRLAQFSFLRVIRAMPELRPVTPNIIRSTAVQNVSLPLEEALNPDIRAVIFDGGIPTTVAWEKWVTPIEGKGVGLPHPKLYDHGVAVTSAFLFGHISHSNLPRPFCAVDHVRVLDSNPRNPNDIELLDVLDRILDHLDKNEAKYHFVNISLGPKMPITDDEVTVWTASLDERLSRSDTLTTVAVGNDGEIDGLNRIQAPSDAVNVLAVGACDSLHPKNWARAAYSCVGPGRRPGIVKPDGIAFGGSDLEPFMVLTTASKPLIAGFTGTSFASPLALRTAAGVKSMIGDNISPRAIRALMIHKAISNGHSKIDVGWGRFEVDVSNLITCENDEALVVYQGELPVGEHLRADIPMPQGITIDGKIDISATLVIAPEVDPEHPGSYTRSGLEVAFRPNSLNYNKPNKKTGKTPKHPKTTSFFSTKNMYGKGEYELREDGSKWEPCLKNTRSFLSKSLHKPCFDIYYHHREGGSATHSPRPILYALIVSVKAPKLADFYNHVVRTYTNVLVPLKPQVQIQVQTQH